MARLDLMGAMRSWRAGRGLVVAITVAVVLLPAMLWVDGWRRERAARVNALSEARGAAEAFRLRRLAVGGGSDIVTLEAALSELANTPAWASVAPEAAAAWRDTLATRIWKRCEQWDPRASDAGTIAQACLTTTRRVSRHAAEARLRLKALGPALRSELAQRVSGAATLESWRAAARDAETWGGGGGDERLTWWADSVTTLADKLVSGAPAGVAIDTVVSRWVEAWGVPAPLQLYSRPDTLTLVVPQMMPWHTALYRHADWRPRLRSAGWRTLQLRDATGILTLPDSTP